MSGALAGLLAPLGEEVLLTDCWDVRHLRVRTNDPRRHARLLTCTDVERLVQGELLRWQQDLALADAHSRPDAARMERLRRHDGTVDAEAVFTAFAEGATVVLNDLTRHAPAVAELCRRLAGELHLRVQANGYLSPPDAQGFPVHFDTHDVLILQCSGSKRWRIHRRVCDAPREADGRDLATDEAGPAIDTFDLAPGDTLYIPRGVAHQADCSADAREPSLHLSIGIHPLTWADLLHQVVEQAAASDPALRRSLPPRWLGRRAELTAGLATAAAGMCGEGAVEAAAASLLARLRQTSGRRFHDAAACRDLDQASRLTPRQPGTVLVQRQGGRVALRFPGGFLRGPERIGEALDLIAARGGAGVTVEELPGLDAEGRLVLARRLVLIGALERADG